MNKGIKGLIITICLFFFSGCNSNSGLNKPITQELSAEELRANLKNDEQFEGFYNWCRGIGDWIVGDNMKTAKYGDITYQQLWEANYTLIDRDNIDAQHLALFPKRESWRNQADSILYYIDVIRPDSLVKLEFYKKVNYDSFFGTQTKYYFWLLL